MQRSAGIATTGEREPVFVESSRELALLQPLEKMDAASFYGRCAAFALLAVRNWFLIG